MGALYGLVQRRRIPAGVAAGAGAVYGAVVWASSYVGWVPKLGNMPSPAWDRPGRPTAMLLAHGVYGIVLAEVVNRLQSAPHPHARPLRLAAEQSAIMG